MTGRRMVYGDMSHDGWRRLAAALLLQAVRDITARPWPALCGPGHPEEAREWLQSDWALGLAEILGLDDSLRRWLRCPSQQGKTSR
jgi:hypothetical protein